MGSNLTHGRPRPLKHAINPPGNVPELYKAVHGDGEQDGEILAEITQPLCEVLSKRFTWMWGQAGEGRTLKSCHVDPL